MRFCCVWCWSKKYTESFGGKNILHCAVGFLPLKVEYIFVLTQDSVQIRSKFFLSATLHTQNLLKEIAYILTCFQALLKVQIFVL